MLEKYDDRRKLNTYARNFRHWTIKCKTKIFSNNLFSNTAGYPISMSSLRHCLPIRRCPRNTLSCVQHHSIDKCHYWHQPATLFLAYQRGDTHRTKIWTHCLLSKLLQLHSGENPRWINQKESSTIGNAGLLVSHYWIVSSMWRHIRIESWKLSYVGEICFLLVCLSMNEKKCFFFVIQLFTKKFSSHLWPARCATC